MNPMKSFSVLFLSSLLTSCVKPGISIQNPEFQGLLPVSTDCTFFGSYEPNDGYFDASKYDNVISVVDKKTLKVSTKVYQLKEVEGRDQLLRDVLHCGKDVLSDAPRNWNYKSEFAVDYVIKSFRAIHEQYKSDAQGFKNAMESCTSKFVLSKCNSFRDYKNPIDYPWAGKFQGSKVFSNIVREQCTKSFSSSDFYTIEAIENRITFINTYGESKEQCNAAIAKINSFREDVQERQETREYCRRVGGMSGSAARRLSRSQIEEYVRRCH